MRHGELVVKEFDLEQTADTMPGQNDGVTVVVGADAGDEELEGLF